jgi:hypothetical protein
VSLVVWSKAWVVGTFAASLIALPGGAAHPGALAAYVTESPPVGCGSDDVQCLREQNNVNDATRDYNQAQSRASHICPDSSQCADAQRDSQDTFSRRQQAIDHQQQQRYGEGLQAKREQDAADAQQRSLQAQQRTQAQLQQQKKP